MFGSVLTKVFGSRNQRLVKQMGRIVSQINALEDEYAGLDDNQLKTKTAEFKQRISDGASLDDLMVETFALTREASKRSLGLRHFDMQLIGGIVLHEGKISEMRTGEGKTLVATLPAYLNALTGNSVHIVTVNDYLAKRDSAWMGQVFEQLGLTVGVIYSGQPFEEKQAAYNCDIVYGTNNEFGFDYLRDNMAFLKERRVQGSLSFAIVDEVDSILIDEARTPLVISGPAEESTDLYQSINKLVPDLVAQVEEDGPGDFSLDEKSKQVFMTEEGHEHAEQLLEKADLLPQGSSLYDVSNIALLHHLYAALRAKHLFHKDVDYVINNGQIVIIDEFSGRMMPGRRWSDGLHQAIEAKENVAVQQENQTLASITFQNYFRLYTKLSGMTGTADTEATEFQEIYGLEVVVIPTNKDMIREDAADVVFRTAQEKYMAMIESIKEARIRDQPVLVGTASIESSELLSSVLKKEKIEHEVLNAKQHEREAQIIAQAGRPGAVTIATNMAGRGTDIVLGGNLELELSEAPEDEQKQAQIKAQWKQRNQQVIDAGGLFVMGTERNESRRVDNQLRGRSGRQGDPGLSRFYLSMEDSLMRIFGSDRVAGLMEKMGMEDGEAIEHPWVTKAIENAQKKVEGKNFDARKQLLEYDDVANEQRKVVYQERNALMDSDNISENIQTLREEVVNSVISRHIPYQSMEEQWDVESLEKDLVDEFNLKLPVKQMLENDDELHEETLRDLVLEKVVEINDQKQKLYTEEVVQQVEKAVMLRMLDIHWKEHLANMDHLRQGIGLRGYAQKNPKQEYKRESFELFSTMLDTVKTSVVTTLAKFEINTDAPQPQPQPQVDQSKMKFEHAQAAEQQQQGRDESSISDGAQPYTREMPKVGRNEPCPCGSGKKYKRCHGRLS